MKTIGKCPHCGEILEDNEIRDVDFRGVVYVHTAYICMICDTIIGFGVRKL